MLKTDLVPTALNSISQANNELNDQLKAVSAAFGSKKIYPHLRQLEQRMDDLAYLKKQQPYIQAVLDEERDLTSLKSLRRILRMDNVSESNVRDNMEDVFLFIQWAIPVVRDKISEGRNLHYTIENSLNYEWDNLFSADKCRGFIFINIASDSSDDVKIYYCRFDKRMKRSDYTGRSINLDLRKEVPLDKPSVIQRRTLNRRSSIARQARPDPPMVWVTALENFSLQTLEEVAKERFVSRLIEEVRKKQR